jgi:polar amino acid transport system substrate-binding protein
MARPSLRGARLPAVLLAGLLAGCSAIAQTGASTSHDPHLLRDGMLTICTSVPYEPFEYDVEGETVGFDIDLATKVADRMKLQPVFLNKDFDAIASGELLNVDACDLAIAGLSITGDRARAIDFSSPYFNAAQAMLVAKSASATSLADLAGRKIAVQSGSTAETYVTDNAPSTTDVVTFESPEAMAEAVSHGLVAAAVYDNTVVGGIVGHHSDLKLAAEFFTGEQYGMAVQKNGNVELLRIVNDVIATLKKDGGYNKIYDKWFGAAS